MVRIVDASTRIIDIDFGQVTAAVTRNPGEFMPVIANYSGYGESQIINQVSTGRLAGSFVQFDRVDLSMMTMNNEVMQPVECVVQRPAPVPLGFCNNGSVVDGIEEYIYVFSRPLDNTRIAQLTGTDYNVWRLMGLDASEPNTLQGSQFEGNSGAPTREQTIYAEKRTYHADTSRMLTTNGLLAPYDPLTTTYNTLEGLPILTSVINWGSMSAITGPNLFVYRVVINYADTLLDNPDVLNLALGGGSSRTYPPVNIEFLCKDPKYSEGEYLTRIANAMGNQPVGGEVADA